MNDMIENNEEEVTTVATEANTAEDMTEGTEEEVVAEEAGE